MCLRKALAPTGLMCSGPVLVLLYGSPRVPSQPGGFVFSAAFAYNVPLLLLAQAV
jgi:hypothetical protein